MIDRYKNIRRALEMGPTPGPWVHDGDGVSAYDEDVAVAVSCPSDAEAAFIAACDPDTIRALLAERDALREALTECLRVNETDAGDDVAVWANAMLIAHAALAQGQENKA